MERSDSVRDWLRRSGSINGSGSYPFLITAVDGSPDLLQVQIWTQDGDFVYDNGNAQPLGGGSIVLHQPK